jgi:maleylacetate reductase
MAVEMWVSDAQTAYFGRGCLQEMAPALTARGATHVFVVGGKTTGTGVLRDVVLNALQPLATTVWAHSVAHAPSAVVQRCYDDFVASGADALVAIGGSSSVEVARLVRFMAAANCPVTDLFTVTPDRQVPAGVPLFAVSTTVSLGESTDLAGITDETTGVKHLRKNRRYTPEVIFAEPDLMITTPRDVWASTALKALDSALSAYVLSAVPQPIGDAPTVVAVDEMMAGLRRLARGEDTADDRCALYRAAWVSKAACYLSPRVAGPGTQAPWLAMALRHQLGGITGANHAKLSAVITPWSLRFHADDDNGRVRELVLALGYDTVEAFAQEIAGFLAAFALPTGLGELGVRPEHVEQAARESAREQPGLIPREHEMADLIRQMI